MHGQFKEFLFILACIPSVFLHFSPVDRKLVGIGILRIARIKFLSHFFGQTDYLFSQLTRKLSGFPKYHVPGIVVYHPVSLLAAGQLKYIHQGHVLHILAERSYQRRIPKHRPDGFNFLE